MKNLLSLIFLLSTLCGCAYVDLLSTKSVDVNDLKGSSSYNYKDITGQFTVARKFGVNKAGNFVSKKILYSTSAKNFLERFVSIAKRKKFSERVEFLSPEVSEAVFWLEGKKHKSLIEVDDNILSVVASVNSKVYKKLRLNLDRDALHCFYSQLTECVALTNFLHISKKKKLGQMNLSIIWDGYPFFNEQYLSQTNSIVQRAKFSYLEESKGLLKYQLEVGDQVLLYFLDNKFRLKNFYWISKGIIQERESS